MDERAHDRYRRALVRRAEADPFFLASVLKDYAESEGLTDEDLAARLGCATDALDPIRLCRRPASGTGDFRRDVERIAERFGLRVGELAQIIRQVDALATLRREGAAETGRLQAARDREPEASDGVEEAR